MTAPTHRERQLMEYLRGKDWVKVFTLPRSERVFSNLLNWGWIEKRGTGNEMAYRITDKGLTAVRARVRIYR
jgi:hypothetical protein